MSRFFTIDRANERIPEVRELLLLLRSQREELIELRDRYVALTGAARADADTSPAGEAGEGQGRRPKGPQRRTVSDSGRATELEEARRITLRIKGIVDQMGASVARIDGWGITLRDIRSGLIDFPALVNGRQVWLCWRLGEGEIDWWHELDAGFEGRRRIADLE